MLTPWIVPSFVVAVLFQFMWQSDVGIVNKVLVDYTGVLHHRPIWLLGGEHDVGDRDPVGLARAAVRDDLLPRRAAGDAARTARGRGHRRRRPVASASATSRCRCCAR